MSSIKDAKEILQSLLTHGYEAYIVGGYVRDLLLEKENADIDIATNALPEEVKLLFSKTILTGEKHGTITIRMNHSSYEVTTFRTDGVYLKNRKPKEVNFVSDLNEDINRRDFTMNALALSIDDTIIDYVQGKEDIKNKIIRTVGNPFRRFEEDALRMLRAFRFVSTLGFDIENETFQAIKEKAHLIENISQERILTEFEKMIKGKYFYKTISLLTASSLHIFLKPLKKGLEKIVETQFKPNDLYEFLTFCAVVYNHDEITQLPIPNIMKKDMRDICQMYDLEVSEFSKLLLFRHGLDKCLLVNKINHYLRKYPDKMVEIEAIYHDMPIHKPCDLAFNGDKIIELYNKKPGIWVGNLLDELCLKVLMGEISNDSQKIRQYLLSKH